MVVAGRRSAQPGGRACDTEAMADDATYDPNDRPTYDPASFWETRLRGRFNLDGAGFQGLGVQFNTALYRQRAIVLERVLRQRRIRVGGAAVVELGPGTGFYVAEWERRGAASVVGLDITEVACVALRARFPRYRFEQADVAEAWPVEPASADLVAAFDVLFHIVDDARFEAAVGRIGDALRPGGTLILSDMFLHGPPVVGFHQVLRSLEQYRAALDRAGLDIVGRTPVFVSMHPAIDLPPGRRRRLAERWWTWLEARLRADRKMGHRWGRILGAVDRAATAVLREGPSTEVLVARRRAD